MSVNTSNKLRLFIGIFPSQATREILYLEAKNWCEKQRVAARLLSPESLHLTIKFIGSVHRTKLDNFTTAFLKATGRSTALLQTEQLTLFPSRKPRVIAVTIAPSTELQAIFQAGDRSFEELGIAAETRAFQPHITVARLPKSGLTKRSRHWQQEVTATPLRLVEPIKAIALVHSQLSPAGAKYTIVASIPLNR